jgi:hypothetical protein
MTRYGLILAIATLLSLSPSAQAASDPCKPDTRTVFHTRMGEASLTRIFTTLESVSERNHQYREAVRKHKCTLIKLTGTKSWKEASKAIPGVIATQPRVLATVKKLRKTIPSHKKHVAMVEEAKAAKRQYDAMVEVAVPDSSSQRYLQNIEALRGWVTDLNKTTKHLAGMRKRMGGIIKQHNKPEQ